MRAAVERGLAAARATAEQQARAQRDALAAEVGHRHETLLAAVAAQFAAVTEQARATNAALDARIAGVDAALAGLAAARRVAATTPLHGMDYEEEIHEHLKRIAAATGDAYTPVGTVPGTDGHSKAGDGLARLRDGGPAVVMEAKDRTMTKGAMRTEMARARGDREALVGLLVTRPASLPEGSRLVWLGRCDLAVAWDPGEPGAAEWLRIAYGIARMQALLLAPRDPAAGIDRSALAARLRPSIATHIEAASFLAAKARSAAASAAAAARAATAVQARPDRPAGRGRRRDRRCRRRTGPRARSPGRMRLGAPRLGPPGSPREVVGPEATRRHRTRAPSGVPPGPAAFPVASVCSCRTKTRVSRSRA